MGVISELRDGALILTINRPEQRNALSNQMLTELVDAMERVRDDDEVRAVVMRGGSAASAT